MKNRQTSDLTVSGGRALVCVMLLAVLSATGCATVEPREIDETGPDGCAFIGASQPGGPRFYRYWASIDLGDPAPQTSDSSTQSFVGRTIRTHRIESEFSWRSVPLVFGIAFLSIAGLFAVVSFAMLFQKTNRHMLRRNAVVAAVSLVLAGVMGYLSGSVVSLDNSSNVPVDVSLDGHVFHLPPQSYVNTRIGGFGVRLHVLAAGQPIERATLYPDEGVLDGVRRLLWGNGAFVYTVCGLNSYRLGNVHYVRRD